MARCWFSAGNEGMTFSFGSLEGFPAFFVRWLLFLVPSKSFLFVPLVRQDEACFLWYPKKRSVQRRVWPWVNTNGIPFWGR